MPREVVALGPRHLIFRDYRDSPLRSDEIRVRSRLSAAKHGSMLPIYRGTSPMMSKIYDPVLGLYSLDKTRERETHYPMYVGNVTIGLVSEVGANVKEFHVGERVYGGLPFRETHTVMKNQIRKAPPELSDEELACLDPAYYALMGVYKGNIKIGEKVAVFGLGAIGLIAIQMAKISGGILVVGVDPIEKRRELARRYGADILFNPEKCDIGLEIKRVTEGKGADISIEVSGSYQALNQAIRATRRGGIIATISRYHQEARGNLGEEWHVNYQSIISASRWGYEGYPRWDEKRIRETIMELFRNKRLTVTGMLDPLVKFEDVFEAFRMIDEEPEKTVKLGVQYE